jgi:hypothetical protein
MSKSLRVFAALAAIVSSLAACAPYIQDSSGREYLNGGLEMPSHVRDKDMRDGTEFGRRLRQAAAVEPGLRFPARIGIARIERREITAIPPDEAAAWLKLAERLGPRFGEFVPISPLVAEMVAGEQSPAPSGPRHYADIGGTIRKLRLGAARQHVDFAIVYEVAGTTKDNSTLLSFTDLSIVGMFIVPSRHLKAEGFASALMLDVRNGYPYGTATARADDQNLVPTIGSEARSGDLLRDVRTAAVVKLTGEVEKMAEALYLRRASQLR